MNDLFGGIDPPVGKINPDYEEQPGNSRKCIQCAKMHDTIVEDTRTGERLSEIDKCKDCLMSVCKFNWRSDKVELQTLIRPETPPSLKESEDGVLSEWGGTARCMTSEGRNVNMAEELNRLEKQLISEG